jgi:hypothetical protein
MLVNFLISFIISLFIYAYQFQNIDNYFCFFNLKLYNFYSFKTFFTNLQLTLKILKFIYFNIKSKQYKKIKIAKKIYSNKSYT